MLSHCTDPASTSGVVALSITRDDTFARSLMESALKRDLLPFAIFSRERNVLGEPKAA